MESNHVNDNECKSTSDWRSREINPFQLLKKLVYSRMHRVILVVGCVSRLWNPWGALPPTTRTLQWAETLNGYSLQSLDDRQQNFRFRPHMVLTMLFSWTNRQRNRKNSILFSFFFFTYDIFNDGKGKFEHNIFGGEEKIWESRKLSFNQRILLQLCWNICKIEIFLCSHSSAKVSTNPNSP